MRKVYTAKQKEKIQTILLEWYGEMGRHDLPWRHTDDLYRIAISEIMAQQTNIPKVLAKYEEFLAKFPTVEKLARARQSSVLRAWQGLGYNRRALNLHRMAKIIVSDYGGVFPEDPELLGELPGIGPYTRHAILVFGRNHDLSAVDVNVERVVRRLYGEKKWETDKKSRDKQQALIAAFVPVGKSRDWHGALMDFASSICTKKSPKCERCPLQKMCPSFPDPDDYVIARKKEIGRTENGKHIPRRIYRGRIIDVLRKGSLDEEKIGTAIKADWNSGEDMEWLADILEILAREEIIIKKKSTWRLK